jgi:glycosyltransferase involved in cell wall biosynthesis
MIEAAAGRRLSLMLVSLSYPPVLGGSEIEAQRVCAGLVRRGHRVTVLCAGGPPMPDVSHWTDPFGVPVRILARRQKGLWRDRAFAISVAWILLREHRNYQFVYFLMQGLHLATGLPVARVLRKPIFMKFSGSSLITLMRNSWVGRLELRWLGRWAHRVMVLNEGMENEAAGAGLDRKQLVWMPNPVDTADFAPCAPAARAALRTARGLDPDTLAVLYVGRLAPEKELASLIDAFALLAARVPRARLILVGDGPLRSELQARATAAGVASEVRFVGRQTVDEVRQWLQAADVFTLVSSNEGFSCSLVEAMSVGLPSVVSDIAANAQLIEPGVHGLHAKVGSADAIADSLVRLLEDADARASMGRAARQRVTENYSTDRILDIYERLFEDALR